MSKSKESNDLVALVVIVLYTFAHFAILHFGSKLGGYALSIPGNKFIIMGLFPVATLAALAAFQFKFKPRRFSAFATAGIILTVFFWWMMMLMVLGKASAAV